MKHRFIHDPQDPSDGFSDMVGAEVFYTNFFPAAGHSPGNPFGSVPQVVLPTTSTPTIPAEAVEAQSAQNGAGGPGSVVAEVSGGGLRRQSPV